MDILTFLGTVLAIIIVLLLNLDFSGRKVHFEADYRFSRVADEENYNPEIEGKPRKNKRESKELLSHPQGITSLHDNLLRGVRHSGDLPFLGRRPIVNGVAQDFVFESYNIVYEKIMAIGAGLKDLGLEATSKVGLYSINRSEWVIAEHACYAYNLVTVPLYDTLGDEALEYIIKLTEMPILFCSADKVENLLSCTLPTLKTIVVMDIENLDKKLKETNKCKIYGFEELLRIGQKKPLAREPTNLDSICTICFTSGTTGMPKGVLLTHGNILSFVAGIEYNGENNTGPKFSNEDVHLSFLPLAHIFERAVQAALVYYGGSVGFYQGDTLKLLDDVAALRPTVFVAVPRLYNRIYEKVMAGVNSAGGIKKALFDYAYSVKKENLKKGTVVHKLWDRIVFKAVKSRLGGRVKYLITGSAPIAGEVMEFLRICFSAYVIEGYGQTETSAGATTTNMYDLSTGHIGVPMPQCIIKLRDVPSMNYYSTDTPFPRGEICIKGNNVFKGYYKQPDKTAESLSADGWNYTGDVGMWDSQGRLKIIDRVKNIFKLSQGEYVAPDKLETVYGKHPALAQSFIYGDSLQSTLVAIIVPGDGFESWAHELNFTGKASELVKNKKVEKALVKTLSVFGREEGLKGFEIIKNLRFELEPFSPENGLLSPTFKSKRHELKLFYQKQIDEMYAELNVAES